MTIIFSFGHRSPMSWSLLNVCKYLFLMFIGYSTVSQVDVPQIVRIWWLYWVFVNVSYTIWKINNNNTTKLRHLRSIISVARQKQHLFSFGKKYFGKLFCETVPVLNRVFQPLHVVLAWPSAGRRRSGNLPLTWHWPHSNYIAAKSKLLLTHEYCYAHIDTTPWLLCTC